LCILLALYNGARHLPEQLQSYLGQTRGDWCLLASDDGSADHGPDMLRDFGARAGEDRVWLIEGPRKGHFAQNFLHLLRSAPDDVPFVALSDQDDVWLPDKAARAVSALTPVPQDVPALYCARTIICDDDLQVIGRSSLFSRPPSFRNALVQSIGGGNTMVLNRAALELAQAASVEAGEIVAHDWWLYQIVTGAGGEVIYDPRPALKYRQHAHNQIGSNLSYRAKLQRLAMILNGRFRAWNAVNVAALERSAHRFTPEAQRRFAYFARAHRSRNPVTRLWALSRSGVYRQGRTGTMALYLSCLLRRM
jgi:glycosyltransferase involved in cell wall biosynthesis